MNLDQDRLIDEAALKESLRSVSDPEIGVNIVDLGLVYRLQMQADAVEVDLAMTSPACPMWEMMAAEVEEVLTPRLPPGRSVRVFRAEEPAWDPSMMTERAKSILGW